MAGSEVIHKWDYSLCSWIPEEGQSAPEAAPPKQKAVASDRKISELLARIAGLQDEIRTLKNEKTVLLSQRSELRDTNTRQSKRLSETEKEYVWLYDVHNTIFNGIKQEIPGILDKMDGQDEKGKTVSLAGMIREIIRINRKGSLSCVLVDQVTQDKLRVGVNIKNNGSHITISASGTGKKLRGRENAVERPIGHLTLENGDVILHIYEGRDDPYLTQIKINSAVNLGNAKDEV